MARTHKNENSGVLGYCDFMIYYVPLHKQKHKQENEFVSQFNDAAVMTQQSAGLGVRVLSSAQIKNRDNIG